ncbi:MAG: malonyl-CoA decarboxylase N-terminal domain-containing protein, partial [Limnohabitans sp.]
MFERFTEQRSLELARQTAKRLMGAQGESNAQSIAIKLIEHYERLSTPLRLEFFDFLGQEFNPDPQQVKAVADAYLANPSADNLVRLFHVVEPDRQELLRRLLVPPGHRLGQRSFEPRDVGVCFVTVRGVLPHELGVPPD